MDQYSEHSDNNQPSNKEYFSIKWKPYALVLATFATITFGGTRYLDYYVKKSFEKHEAEHKPEHKPEMEKIESRLTILDHDAPIRDDIYKRTMQIIERASLARTYADAKYELPAKNPDLQPHAI